MEELLKHIAEIKFRFAEIERLLEENTISEREEIEEEVRTKVYDEIASKTFEVLVDVDGSNIVWDL